MQILQSSRTRAGTCASASGLVAVIEQLAVLENAGADAGTGVLEWHEVAAEGPGQFVKVRTGAERCGIRCEPFGSQIDVRMFVKSAFG